MKFDYPTSVRFQCTKCGICCGDTKKKTRHILLLKTEAERIAAATSQPISEFALKVEGKAPYGYEMRKTPEDGKCVLLEENHCVIYSWRPLICRFYPFELKVAANGKYKFLHTDECPGTGEGKTLTKKYFEKLFQLAHVNTKVETEFSNEKDCCSRKK